MDVISPDAAAGCGYVCIGYCVALCFMPPFYMVAISDDVGWSAILASPPQ